MKTRLRADASRGASFVAPGFAGRLASPLRPMERGHHHQEIELNLVLAGEASYLHGGSVRRLAPGRLAVFWGAVPHAVVGAKPGTSLCWLTLPLAMARGWGLPPEFLGRLLAGEWIEGPEGGGARFPIRDWLRELEEEPAAASAGVACELQGCLRWLARRAPAVRPGSRRAVPARDAKGEEGLRAVEAMARHMTRHYTEPLGVAQIAAAAGWRPNRAMAVFRRRCGLTLGEYLARLRVTHAQRLLIESDAKVADIAYACGFGTASAFHARFARFTGLSPGRFRERARAV